MNSTLGKLAVEILAVFLLAAPLIVQASTETLHQIAQAPSAERIERDIGVLVGFWTRHTLSETKSQTRGIGAARRWIEAEFKAISSQCGVA
jgi:hypothetical protein